MSIEEYADVLGAISREAKPINEITDELNKEIGELEIKLAEAGVGLTVWADEIIREDDVFATSPKGKRVPAVRSVVLGYGKESGDWCILAREIINPREASYPPNMGSVLSDCQIPLRRADRETRLVARQYFRSLLESVLAEVREKARDLKEMKALHGDDVAARMKAQRMRKMRTKAKQ